MGTCENSHFRTWYLLNVQQCLENLWIYLFDPISLIRSQQKKEVKTKYKYGIFLAVQCLGLHTFPVEGLCSVLG